MIRRIENEPEHWAAIENESNALHKIKMVAKGLEAFSHHNSFLFRKYVDKALLLSNDPSIPNLYRFVAGYCAFTVAMRSADTQFFQHSTRIFQQVLNEEKAWFKTYYYVYNISIFCNHIGALLKVPSAHQHSIYYLLQSANLLNVTPASSTNVKKSHKLIISSIGVSYTELGEYKLAQQYLMAAQKSAEQDNYTDALPIIYIRFGSLYTEMQQHDLAIAYYDKAFALGYQPELFRGIALEKKAISLLGLQRAKEALPLILEAIQIADKFTFLDWKIRAMDTLKAIYFALGQYKNYAFCAVEQQQYQAQYLPMRHLLYAFWAELSALQSPENLIQPHLIDTPPYFQESPDPENAFAKQLIDMINTYYNDVNFGVESLAEYMGMSARTLFRKTQEVLKESPLHFIRQTRLKAAASLLEQGQTNIGAIASRVGFRSNAYFTKIFREEYGVPPSEYMT